MIKNRFIFLFFLILGCQTEGPQEINVGILNLPRSLKSFEIRDAASSVVGHQVHRGLLTYHPETGEIINYAAKEWFYSENYTKLNFELRNDVKFHDGSTLTCHDVKNSFERLNTSGDNTSLKFPDKISFTCDKSTFSIKMDIIPSIIFDLIASPTAGISKGNGEIGIGPFKIVKYQADKIELQHNSEHRKKLNFIIGSQEELKQKFSRGEIDDLIYLGFFEEIKLPHCQAVTGSTPTAFWFNLNTKAWAFDKLEYRKILQSLLHKVVLQTALFEKENPLNGLIPYGLLGHNQAINNFSLPDGLDQLRARLLLLVKKHGRINFTLRDANKTNYDWSRFFTLLDPEKKIFNIEFLDNQVFFKKYYEKKLELFFIGANISRNDPFEVFSFFRKNDKVNPSRIEDDFIDKSQVEYSKASSIKVKNQIAIDANNWIIQNAFVVPLFSKRLNGCVSKRLENLKVSPLGPLVIDYSIVEKSGEK